MPKTPDRASFDRPVVFSPAAIATGQAYGPRERLRSICLESSGWQPVVSIRGREYVADLSKANGWSGLNWHNGVLRLERNPEFHPLRARGFGSNPGKYFDLLNTPQVESAIEDLVSAICVSPWRLEAPKLPPWAAGKPDHEMAAARQLEFAQRVWWEWTRADQKRQFANLMRDILRNAPVYGFYLGEIVGKAEAWQLQGDPSKRIYWRPQIPEWRASWTVREWLIQEDEVVGVWLDTSHSVDSTGQSGSWQTIIPTCKLLHVAARQTGENPEGRSHLRSAQSNVEMLRNAEDTEAIGIEGDGTGTRVITSNPEKGMDVGDREKLEAHLANYVAKHMPWVILPPGADMKILSPNSAILETGGPVSRNERAIGFGMGNLSDLVATQKHGSNAAKSAADAKDVAPFAFLAKSYIGQPVAELLGRFIRWNFPEDDIMGRIYAPTLEVGPVERTDVAAQIATLALAVEKGVLTNPVTRAPAAAALGLELPLDLPEPEPEADPEAVAADVIDIPPVIEPSRAELLTTQEAAAILRVASGTVIAAAKSGRLQAAGSVGKRLRFRVEDVEAFLSIPAAPVNGLTPSTS